MSLERKILERIEREGLRPKPPVFFILRDLLRGGEFLFWLAFSGLALAAAVFLVFERHPLAVGVVVALWMAIFLFGIYREYSDVVGLNIFPVYKFGALPLLSALLLVNGALGYGVLESGKAEEVSEQIEQLPAYEILEIGPAEWRVPETRKELIEEKNQEKDSDREEAGEKSGEDQERKNDEDDEDEENEDGKETDRKDYTSRRSDGDSERHKEDDEDEDKDNDRNIDGEVRGVADRKADYREQSEERRQEEQNDEQEESEKDEEHD